MKAVTIFATYSPAHSDITYNEEADRLAKVAAKHAKKLQKEKRINCWSTGWCTVKIKSKIFFPANLSNQSRKTSRNNILIFATRNNYRHTKAEEDIVKIHGGPKDIQTDSTNIVATIFSILQTNSNSVP